MKKASVSLGNHLVTAGLLRPEELKQVESEMKRSNEPFQRVLKRLRLVDGKKLIAFLSDQFKIPAVEISHQIVKPEVLKLVPQELIRKFQIFPLMKIGSRLTVAMDDPFNLTVMDQLRLRTGLEIEPALATESEIRGAIEQYYGIKSDMSDVLHSIGEEALQVAEKPSSQRPDALIEEAPIIKLVNTMITQAVRENASDIHVSPEKDKVTVRYRVDGVLHEVDQYLKSSHAGVVSRVKVMANLDISETRIPQDGRIRMDLEGRAVDLRISVMPTIHGENLVIRLLNVKNSLMRLEQLGMAEDVLPHFRDAVARPYGIFLITGPTGSGKTTTLYAALNQINTPGKNIVTIEDPVEYQLPLARQIQVNPKVQLTFASGLRSILRQDPDVIMVGEIRDRETAEIAIQAALTGHFVLSTLHTNDAPSAVTRLVDMGIEPFLISSTVTGILAQRLVRVICKDCRAPYPVSDADLARLKSSGLEIGKEPSPSFYKGKGCLNCKKTGYKGRSGIFELMLVDEPMRKSILMKRSADDIRQYAQSKGMKTLRQDGMEKVKAGTTTIEEVLRATREE